MGTGAYDQAILQELRQISSLLDGSLGAIRSAVESVSDNFASLLALVAFGVMLYALSWFVRKGGRL